MSNLTAENRQKLMHEVTKLANKYGFEGFTLVLDSSEEAAVISNSINAMETSLEVISRSLEQIRGAKEEAKENSVDTLEDTRYGQLFKENFPALWEQMPTKVEHDLYLKFKDMDGDEQERRFNNSIPVLELMNKIVAL